MAVRKQFLDLTRQGKHKRLRTVVKDNSLHGFPDLNFSSSEENDQISASCTSSEQQPRPTFTDFDILSDESVFCQFENEDRNLPINDVQGLLNDSLATYDDESGDDLGSWESIDEKERMCEDLRKWSLQFHVTNVALSALLSILRVHNCFQTLPSDARTLLKTPLTVPVEPVFPGFYSHIGLKVSLQKIWSRVVESVDSIDLLVGIDGLPLFKSNSGELWPILVSILNVPSLTHIVFPVGVYYGKKKPLDCKLFLSSFVDEVKDLIKNGVFLNGKKVLLCLKGFSLDAPAKSFILGTKGHTGYSSCTKCKQEGSFYNNRVTFPDIPCKEELKFSLRTSEEFLNKEDPEFNTSDTPLTSIPGLDFISSFPLDYMHLVCLGVMRTILYIWMFASVPLKLPHNLISSISTNLCSLQSSIPSEFCRKPRGLDEVKRWKATEFRQFLLYTGPLVLQDVLLPHRKNLYDNFLCLHISLRILLSPKYCTKHNTYAEDLLNRFLKTVKTVYGQQYITHNFHGLLHLASDVASFGPLDSCSAFKFENYLQTLKQLVRKGDRPLQQIVKRISEKFTWSTSKSTNFSENSFPYCSSTHFSGPLLNGCDASKQYKKLHFQSFTVTTSKPNSCCSLVDGRIIVVLNIVFYLECFCIIFKCFEKTEDFYGHPFCQSSSLGIFLVSELSSETQIKPVSDILEKLVLLPTKSGQYLALPLLHFEQI